MDFNSLVLKVASRCNLNCSYCFMYNLGDTTFKRQPKFMTADTVDHILEKTKRYIKKYNKKEFSFLFHGGEPLLAPKEFFRGFIDKVNHLQKELKEVTFSYDIQTNGVLLDNEWISIFNEFNIAPSVSVDGTEKAHDMFRVDHKGNGSYKDVFKGVQLLKQKMDFADIACVINTKEDPIETYNSFKKMKASYVNFLIPDYTHDSYPFDKNKTEMADWLIKLFDIWIDDPEKYKIPMFIGLLNSLLRIEENHKNEVTVLVVETNGEIEAVDSLKACGQGFTKTGLNIAKDELDAIEKTSLGKLYFNNFSKKLSRQCQECPLQEICRGGRLVNRYSKAKGFNNPSVYCNDLIKFIAHIQHYFITSFPNLNEKENIQAIQPEEIKAYLKSISKKIHTYKEEELESFAKNNNLIEA